MNIFISHANRDYDVVSHVVELLQLGAGIPKEQIFCTSEPGTVHNGEFFVKRILTELNDAKVIIALLSKAYNDSHFCLAELGAAQAIGMVKKEVLKTFLLPPMGFANLDGVMHGVQSGVINRPDDLGHLFDHLKAIGVGSGSTADWEKHRNDFISRIADSLDKRILTEDLKKVMTEYILFKRSTNKDDKYKMKMAGTFRNLSDHEFIAKKPTWSAKPDQIQCRPNEWSGIQLGLNSGEEVENWQGFQEQITVKKGDRFRAFVALDPDVSNAEYLQRHEQKNVGIMQLPIITNNKDFSINFTI